MRESAVGCHRTGTRAADTLNTFGWEAPASPSSASESCRLAFALPMLSTHQTA
jgi:hypothetical protein